MKKFVFAASILAFGLVFAELPILQTKFRKAPPETLSEFAVSGNAEAQLELALRYYAGHQAERDEAQAFQWMTQAAAQGHPEAMHLLSLMYAEGIGVEADPKKETLWLANALAAEPSSETFQERYEQLLSESENKKEILRVFADAGYLPAILQVRLPDALELFNNQAYADALPLLRHLAENGSAEAAWYASRIYTEGLGGFQVDDVEAFILCRLAAEGGYAQAQYNLAVLYETGRGTAADPALAASWYEKSAQSGYTAGQFQTAEIEFSKAVAAGSFVQAGDDNPAMVKEYRNHLRKAVQWYQAAADQKHAQALYVLGRLSASGEGVPKNYRDAVSYYEAAVEQGNAEAGFYLGLMLQGGLGVPKDLSAAIQRYQTAANQGVQGAWYYLANCYRFGVGVEKHPAKGEGIYYGRLLRDTRGSQGVTPGYWTLLAAREYGLILWQRAESFDAYTKAAGWVGMAAQNGDALSQEIFLKMVEQMNRPQPDLAFEEHRADPSADAVRLRRTPIIFPYLQRDVEELFPNTDAQQSILTAEISSSYQNVAGDDIQGLLIRYSRPPISRAVDFSGIVLAGIELTDSETGRHYWSLSEHIDTDPSYPQPSISSLFVSVDQTACPEAEITGWAVVYGHLLPDGRTLAVFDTRESRTDNFGELFAENRYSEPVGSTINSSIDYSSIINEYTPGLLDDIFGDGE